MTIIFNQAQLTTWQIVGLIGGAILIIMFIAWLITSVVDMTKTQHRSKILQGERNKQIAFENEVYQFVTAEIKRQLVAGGVIEKEREYYQPEFPRI